MDNHTEGEPYPAEAIPAKPAWTLRAYRTTPEEWDEWVAVRRVPAARAARLWNERHPEPWVKGRRDTQGKAWREHVFTGTHERIEDHRVCLLSSHAARIRHQFPCFVLEYASPNAHNLYRPYLNDSSYSSDRFVCSIDCEHNKKVLVMYTMGC